MNPFERMQVPVVLDEATPLSQAISKLGRSDSCIVVTKGGQYVGIVDDLSAESSSADPSMTKVGHVFRRAPLIENGASLMDICKAFFTGPFKALPVQQDEKVVGILGRMDVLQSLLATGVLVGGVSAHMNSPVVTLDAGATLAQARAKMREQNVRRLVITTGDKVSGLISAHDLRVATDVPKEKAPFVKEKFGMEDHKISSLMVDAEEVATIGPEAKLSEAARRMVEKKIASLVVTSGNKPVGLLSARDVFESVMAQDKAPIYISGLDYEDRMLADEITEEVEKELEKIRKSFDIEYLALHFKKYGRKHSVHARLKAAKLGLFSVSNHGFDLQGAVHGVMAELKKVTLQKSKPEPMHEKRREPFRGSEEV